MCFWLFSKSAIFDTFFQDRFLSSKLNIKKILTILISCQEFSAFFQNLFTFLDQKITENGHFQRAKFNHLSTVLQVIGMQS